MLERLIAAAINLGPTPVAGGSGEIPVLPWAGSSQLHHAPTAVAKEGAAPAIQPGVLMIGKRDGDLEKPADWISGRNVPIQWAESIDAAMGMLRKDRRHSHMLIDIDDLGNIHACIEDIISLRKMVPDIAVILLSEEFQTDDFDLNRIALGDVCLRAPVNFSALAMAMPVAREHNRIWQDRQRLS